MKTAVYVEEGRTQLVLTPENDWEKSILAKIHRTMGTERDVMQGIDVTPEPIDAEIRFGHFYECRGGWMRFASGGEPREKDSLMVIIKAGSTIE